jgi:hypothetical protein
VVVCALLVSSRIIVSNIMFGMAVFYGLSGCFFARFIIDVNIFPLCLVACLFSSYIIHS